MVAFFSKTRDKLAKALRKTAQVLNTDVRTLFVPGRQINDEFLDEIYARLMGTDMGPANVDRIVGAIRDRWRLGRIKNAKEAEAVMRDETLQMLPAPSAPPAPAEPQGRAARYGPPPLPQPAEAGRPLPNPDDRELHF